MKGVPAKSCPACGERYDTDVLFCPRDGTPLASSRSPTLAGNTERDPYLGVEVPGQIRLESLIGIGSMGRVYRAFQGGIERDVAVKVLHRELSGNAELTARFHREAKVASRLVHPNVVQVLMTGALPHGPDVRTGGELYLVMEHLDGISLLSALAAAGTSGEGQALPLPRALHITLQICDAVGEAHAQGIVHRDIKPENVMLVRRGDDPDYVKVLDFGIARLDWADRAATQAGLIFGTAKYISPEGSEGHPVGPAADVYSIATMLYQMLAGRTPFEGDSPVALLVQHTHTPPPPLRSIVRASYVPEPLAAVIMQNLCKKPGDRAQNARLFAKDLVAAARAGGFSPEEIATQSTLFSPASLGAVKLASKERTRSHELSADLASRIGGVAARSEEEEPQRVTTAPVPTLPSGSVATPGPESARMKPGTTTIDLDMDGSDVHTEPDSTLPGAPMPTETGGSLSTMQGTTLSGEPMMHPRRAKLARMVAVVLALLVVVPVVIIGGKKLGASSSATASDSLDGALEEARDHLHRQAWDSPPGRNFKDVTDAAVARWPTSTALVDLRHDAAVKLVAEALGRKYANDPAEAKHLVDLALHFDPQLTTAQHLAAELTSARAPDVAPVPVTSASVPSERKGKGNKPPPGPAPDPRAVKPATTTSAAGRPPPPPPTQGGAVLPPPPRPPDTPPAPTGPWL